MGQPSRQEIARAGESWITGSSIRVLNLFYIRVAQSKPWMICHSRHRWRALYSKSKPSPECQIPENWRGTFKTRSASSLDLDVVFERRAGGTAGGTEVLVLTMGKTGIPVEARSQDREIFSVHTEET